MESFELAMHRRDLSQNVTEITAGETSDRWLVIRRMLDASNISIQVSVSSCCILLVLLVED